MSPKSLSVWLEKQVGFSVVNIYCGSRLSKKRCAGMTMFLMIAPCYLCVIAVQRPG